MPAAAASPLRTARVLATALMGALFIVGIALLAVIHGGSTRSRDGNVVHTHAPAGWVYLVIAVLGLIATVLVQMFGYRIPALDRDLEPAEARSVGVRAFQQSMILRFALSEWVAIVCIALVFSIASNTILPYVFGAAISLVLMAVHVWPSSSLIRRVQGKLDRAGGRSELAQAMTGR